MSRSPAVGWFLFIGLVFGCAIAAALLRGHPIPVQLPPSSAQLLPTATPQFQVPSDGALRLPFSGGLRGLSTADWTWLKDLAQLLAPLVAVAGIVYAVRIARHTTTANSLLQMEARWNAATFPA